MPSTQHGSSVKIGLVKGNTKVPAPSSPVPAAAAASATAAPSMVGPSDERDELLGSLTTQQQQRTSARVIKKLRLDDLAADRDKKDLVAECESAHKLDEIVHPVKQRMPKALWSVDEKNLFFEALNEYGKDFDAITSHICTKMKKKGVSESNIKNKHQVSNLYYRTWHKLSKHVHFDGNVKKVAQELYALINYGELRKKLVSINEKTCSRLGEMIASGSMAVRARGKNLRVRTPMCRALRMLNRMTERTECMRVCSRALVTLRARRTADWARVHAAAHNPRAAASLPLRTELATFIAALERRWDVRGKDQMKMNMDREHYSCDAKSDDFQNNGIENNIQETQLKPNPEDTTHDEDPNPEPDRKIGLERLKPKKLSLHVGPSPNVKIHLPTISPSESLSSQKICFSSYLERIGMTQRRLGKDCNNKIRTPKRQRKDSTTDKDQEQKKVKTDDTEPKKPIDIDDTAIDGIELMANLTEVKTVEEEKPTMEDEKEIQLEKVSEIRVENKEMEIEKDVPDKETSDKEKYASEKEKEMSEREKDSFSEMEDENEKYNKSDTDNESDGKCQKSDKQTKYKNLKVKFRIRERKSSKGGSVSTLVQDVHSSGSVQTSQNDECTKASEVLEESVAKPDFDVDLVMRQIRKGWSVVDAGKLTIGDLYLMFGCQSKIELDYWWSEPTQPLPQPLVQNLHHPNQKQVAHNIADVDKIEKAIDKEKCPAKDKSTPEKGTDSSLEDERDKARESDTDIFSPKNTFSQDSNDGLSGDERKSEQLLASPEHKAHRSDLCNASLRLANKLINRPDEPTTDPLMRERLMTMTSRLRRLLSLAGNVNIGSGPVGGRCACGHICSHQRRKPSLEKQPIVSTIRFDETDPAVFRHPTPIAPKPNDNTELKSLVLSDLPRLNRGRPRRDDSRVVVQRTLPLLPKLPVHNLPIKVVPSAPAAPRKILPKPTTVIAGTNNSYVYVLSQAEANYFNDTEEKCPAKFSPKLVAAEDVKKEVDGGSSTDIKIIKVESQADQAKPMVEPKAISRDTFNSFLPGGEASMSLSPSRLLHDASGPWLEGDVQDFSLSSFLAHLDAAGTKAPTDLAVDTQLQSLLVDSSVDYVAKFADLAAEVADDT